MPESTNENHQGALVLKSKLYAPKDIPPPTDASAAMTVLTVGLGLGFALAAVDLWTGVRPGPKVYGQLYRLCLPGSMTLAAVFTGYALLWCAVAPVLKRHWHIEARASSLTVATFVAITFLGILFLGKLDPHLLREAPLTAVGYWSCAALAGLVVSALLRYRPVSFDVALREDVLAAMMAAGAVNAVTVLWLFTYLHTTGRGAAFTSLVVVSSVSAGFVCVLVLSRRFRYAGLGLLIITSCALLAGASYDIQNLKAGPPAVARASDTEHRTPPRVLLITVDTLRRDAVSAYNPDAPPTPNIDSLATEGVRFTQAYGPSPWTLPSVASFMTGLTPDVHDATTPTSAVSLDFVTLAERFAGAGYATGAFGTNHFLRAETNLDQGFQWYDFYPKPAAGETRSLGGKLARRLVHKQVEKQGTADELTELAWNWMVDQQDTPWFLWLHFFDPHTPYQPPADVLPEHPLFERFGKAFFRKGEALAGNFGRTDPERLWTRMLYDGEVRHVDRQLGMLLSKMRNLDLYDDTLILFTTDHGEEFWDHDAFEHGHTLYNELIWNPLLIKAPGMAGGRTVDTPVSTVALAPTLLDLCTSPYAVEDFSYRSFAPLVRQGAEAYAAETIQAGSLVRARPKTGVIFDGCKYIQWMDDGREELYDLGADPQERQSLTAAQPSRVMEGRRRLAESNAQTKALREKLGIETGKDARMDEETKKGLEALGYL